MKYAVSQAPATAGKRMLIVLPVPARIKFDLAKYIVHRKDGICLLSSCGFDMPLGYACHFIDRGVICHNETAKRKWEVFG